MLSFKPFILPELKFLFYVLFLNLRIASAIVKAIQSKNGRFLKMQGDFFEEVADNVARLKTSQALREGLAPQRNESDCVDVDAPMAIAIAVKDDSDELVYEAIKNEAETVDV